MIISMGIAALGVNYKMIGLYYIFTSPLIHYFIYENSNNKRYYYYFNLGFGKIILWSSTIILGIINFFIFSLL